ncbi:UDP-Glc:alpha-D-GlcNAc-diphosphoundecaprenol beta-1,3-glucosyltransferase WfgD [Stieleria maiorica]|uniref:UDP-Glc:alpha-D-GlcNAc-diphosphoundecaprenol beta-1,3-glucosyltransferase WfgD n=1 Tax=Stieleria maiorica TaxID=2795974 RepID=A0A5B9MPX1_9BACT|nr:glycosyltransferase family 2 protein [Stieleria maiorica]QEG02211.1 UDP-Glc:alpha-D-GlcNAc-diphosphoundecaprenol beta-1,3-glucosyltransferase WfgD [Stieleria maiorica]
MIQQLTYSEPPIPGLVSIVIPAYNRDDFIGATLQTVRDQEYTNWEVIVIEDSSKGETERIVGDFGRSVTQSVSYSRNEQNLGAAASRNRGFAKARGEFIATLDSDDLWRPNHLSRVVDAIRNHGAHIGYAKVQMFQHGTGAELDVYGPTDDEVSRFPISLFNRCFVVPSATVMRREVMEVVGPQSCEHKYCEDFDFFLRCVSSGVEFIHVDDVTCDYRKEHAGATTERLAGTIEEVAYTILRYSKSPAVDRETSLSFAYDNLLAAARLHRRTDPSKDPSADPVRGGQLLIEAWNLRRKDVSSLTKGVAAVIRGTIGQLLSPGEDRTRHRATMDKRPLDRSAFETSKRLLENSPELKKAA